MTDVVRAAGGVVIRAGENGADEVLLVHRPDHDDWTLPKGKAKPGETYGACALREVQEETGLVCELGAAVDVVEYVDADGRLKRLHYFLMRPLHGTFVPSTEVDEIQWLPLEEAVEKLSYDHNRGLVERILRPAGT